MHVAKISAPMFVLVWHFLINVFSMVFFFKGMVDVKPSGTKGALLAFSVIALVVYAFAAAPLLVYSYKYGSSPGNRTSRFLMGVSLMFIFSSLPILYLMKLLISQRIVYDIPKVYTYFITFYLLHAISFFLGIFVTWFAYLHTATKLFHAWRGPERQIPPKGGVELIVSRRNELLPREEGLSAI